MPDQLVAEQLARALEGGECEHDEARDLARLLHEAADAVRFEVSEAETEHALWGVRRRLRPRPRRSLRPAAIALAVGVALVTGVLLTLPEAPVNGFRVQARALRALAGDGTTMHAVLRTRRAGHAALLTREQWSDPSAGRMRVDESVAGTKLDITLAEPARVIVYRPGPRTAAVAGSCTAIPGACATLADPLAVYREALRNGRAQDVRPVIYRGLPGYRFTVPVHAPAQTGTHAELDVVVDAQSYLPRRIVAWETPAAGQAQLVGVTEVDQLDERSPLDPEVFSVTFSPDTRFMQLDRSGQPVRVLGRRQLTPRQAARALPGARWLGRSAQGSPLDAITLLHTSGGNVLRLRYGGIMVWDFRGVVPPGLVAGRLLPAKIFPLGEGPPARFTTVGGRLMAERDFPSGTVAVLAPSDSKVDMLQLLESARPLPSP
jgi:hypothetical protein